MSVLAAAFVLLPFWFNWNGADLLKPLHTITSCVYLYKSLSASFAKCTMTFVCKWHSENNDNSLFSVSFLFFFSFSIVSKKKNAYPNYNRALHTYLARVVILKNEFHVNLFFLWTSSDELMNCFEILYNSTIFT